MSKASINTDMRDYELRYSDFSPNPVCDFGCETEKVKYIVAKRDTKNNIWRLLSVEFSLEDAKKEVERRKKVDALTNKNIKYAIFEKKETVTIQMVG